MRKKVRFTVSMLTKDILLSELDYYNYKLEKLCNLIIKSFGYEKLIPAYKWVAHEPKKIINFNLTKENSLYFEDMFKNTDDDTEAEFLRKIFSTYTNLNPNIRERILFKYKFKELEYITKNKLDIRVNVNGEIYNAKALSLSRCNSTFYNLIELGVNKNNKLYKVKEVTILKIY